jgi:hypothetical protein
VSQGSPDAESNDIALSCCMCQTISMRRVAPAWLRVSLSRVALIAHAVSNTSAHVHQKHFGEKPPMASPSKRPFRSRVDGLGLWAPYGSLPKSQLAFGSSAFACPRCLAFGCPSSTECNNLIFHRPTKSWLVLLPLGRVPT